MASTEKTEYEITQKKIDSVRWFQSFEILPGVVTPGMYPMNPGRFLDELGIPKDLEGLRTLDVGCMDGAMAFEFERRGAESHAVDIQDPDKIAFNTAKEILKSKVEYCRETVYNLAKCYGTESFDIVCFKGVYYHLKDPVNAFDAVADVLKFGGKALIAGECLVSHAETISGEIADRETVEKIAKSKIPITVCYPGKMQQISSSCWFVPNLACLQSWTAAAGMNLQQHFIHHSPDASPRPQQRFVGVTVKIESQKGIEHPVFSWAKGPMDA